jgi:hypothetical protein
MRLLYWFALCSVISLGLTTYMLDEGMGQTDIIIANVCLGALMGFMSGITEKRS